MTVKFGFEPRPWQRDVLEGIFSHPLNSIHVIKSGRQRGKSLMLEGLLVKCSCTNKGAISIAISPTLSQALKLYQDISTPLIGTPLIKSTNSQRLSIKFFNDSEVLFKSAEQKESLRGYTVKNGGVLVLDEAAYIKDDVFYLVQPFVNVSRAPIILTSTPRFKSGFFYDFYKEGLEENDTVFSYDWSRGYDMSEFITDEMLERIRKKIPVSQYMTEYMAEFLDLESSVFGDFSQVFNDNPNKELENYVGIDWGSGSGKDYTSITVLNSNKEMVDLVYFNDKDSTQTIDEIIKVLKQYSPKKTLVEKNSIGAVYFDLLKKRAGRDFIISSFNTTNDSKYKLVSRFQVLLNNKEISLLKDDELINELIHYQTKPSGTGKPTFNAENGFHDDLIFSTMLSIEASKSNKASFDFG